MNTNITNPLNEYISYKSVSIASPAGGEQLAKTLGEILQGNEDVQVVIKVLDTGNVDIQVDEQYINQQYKELKTRLKREFEEQLRLKALKDAYEILGIHIGNFFLIEKQKAKKGLDIPIDLYSVEEDTVVKIQKWTQVIAELDGRPPQLPTVFGGLL